MFLFYIYNELCFIGVVCVYFYSIGEGIRLRYVFFVFIVCISKNLYI